MTALALALAAPGGGAEPDAPPADPAERARHILESGDYQTTLPVDPPSLPVPAPSLLVEAAFWIGLALLVALAVWLLARELGLGDPGPREGQTAAGVDRSASVESMLADSERLAGDGRFDEAVHLLLLVAIRRLSIETGREPQPSSTARELLRAYPLDAARRAGFAALVRTVEWTLFGGRPIALEQYRECRQAFRAVVAR